MAAALVDRLVAIAAGAGDAREATPGLCAVVIRDGKTVSELAIGKRTLSPDAELRITTPMRVASISKLGVAIAAMRLVETGALSLDGPIDVGFPLRHPAFPETPITLRMLLAHTSSLRDGDVYWGTLGEALADFFTPTGARWEGGAHFDARAPGSYYTYCNLAFGVIATAIERATGQRFDLHAHEHVLAPLGMTGGYNWSEVDDTTLAAGAALYRPGPDGSWAASVDAPDRRRRGPSFVKGDATLSTYRVGDNGLLFAPQGGLRASARDVAQFGLLLLNAGATPHGRLLASTTISAMLTPAWRYDAAANNGAPYGGVVTEQGLGLQILTGDSRAIPGQRASLVGHAADAYGLLGGVWVDIEAKAGFVYLLTGGPSDRAVGESGFFAIEEAIMRVLYEAALG